LEVEALEVECVPGVDVAGRKEITVNGKERKRNSSERDKTTGTGKGDDADGAKENQKM